jgi:hypothetical protein
VSGRSIGLNEQIFGVDEQDPRTGSVLLRGISLKAMCEKQRTSTLLLPPQSEEVELSSVLLT